MLQAAVVNLSTSSTIAAHPLRRSIGGPMIVRKSTRRVYENLLRCGFAGICALASGGCRTVDPGTNETSTGLQYRPSGDLQYVENPGVYVGEKSGYPVKPVR